MFKPCFFGISITALILPLHVLELLFCCCHGELPITVPLPLLFLIFQEDQKERISTPMVYLGLLPEKPGKTQSQVLLQEQFAAYIFAGSDKTSPYPPGDKGGSCQKGGPYQNLYSVTQAKPWFTKSGAFTTPIYLRGVISGVGISGKGPGGGGYNLRLKYCSSHFMGGEGSFSVAKGPTIITLFLHAVILLNCSCLK